jgi:hypothetical protein
MSSNLPTLKFTQLDDHRKQVILNGQDISDFVRGIVIKGEVGTVTIVQLEFAARIEVEEIPVNLVCAVCGKEIPAERVKGQHKNKNICSRYCQNIRARYRRYEKKKSVII